MGLVVLVVPGSREAWMWSSDGAVFCHSGPEVGEHEALFLDISKLNKAPASNGMP